MASLDPDTPFTLEVKGAPGLVLQAGLDRTTLMRANPSSRAQQWFINNVFLPEAGLAGYTIVNAETTGAVKFHGVKEPLAMGASRPPVELEVLWLLIAPGQGLFWHFTSVANLGQAIDTYGLNEGSVAGAYGSNDGNERQLFRLRKAAG
jgi:hypothetical protein